MEHKLNHQVWRFDVHQSFRYKAANADRRFADAIDSGSTFEGFDPKGLKGDVPTRWGSVCRLFESAVASCDVLNEVLMKSRSHDHLLSPDEVEEIRIAAKLYRVRVLHRYIVRVSE